ncbi:hypothetical protein PMI13_03033 [Chryseobacterium populi]|uniref:Uncharacterized protein n=1 Tax=Chryseobacterium populi TaxID=1144316 RepID=J3CEJ0_9FLAO|nr:hypothetical protein PMI13_03033 [Chryseobacterium populi]
MSTKIITFKLKYPEVMVGYRKFPEHKFPPQDDDKIKDPAGYKKESNLSTNLLLSISKSVRLL